MEAYVFTRIDQVFDWIEDNKLTVWRFTRDRTEGSNEVIVNSETWESMPEKLEMTRKRLETVRGMHLYGVGKRNATTPKGNLVCEVCLESVGAIQSMIGSAPIAAAPVVDEAAVEARIRKQIELDYERKEYENKRKQLDEELKEFRKDKESLVGLAIGYLKPLIGVLGAKTNIAGVDAQNVVAEPIHSQTATETEAEEVGTVEEDIFSEEESDKMYDLMCRFKKVELQYLELLEKVVTLAESGDATYTMAKGFLIK